MQSLVPIESLQCFLAAAKALNFSKASGVLHLSPAAFGQRIRQLEEYLGIKLFSRTTRRVELTSAGHRMVAQVRSVLELVGTLPEIANDDTYVTPRTMTIGTRHELGMSWLLPLLPVLEDAVPGLRLHLHFSDSSELLRLLYADELDAAICSVRLANRRFGVEVLHEEHYQLVASTKRFKQHPIRSTMALMDQMLIDLNATLPLARYWLDADEERSQLQFSDVRYLGTIGAILKFVLRGEGVAVLPAYFVEPEVRRGRLQVLFPRKKLLTDHFRLLYARDSRSLGVFETLAKIMRESPLQ